MGDYAMVIRTLKRHGLLLEQDKKALSVVGIITGETLSSSWWGHSRGSEVFSALTKLTDRDDVIPTRLIAKKVTFVHLRLFPALLAVATSRERWQTDALSPRARALLRRVGSSDAVEAVGAEARELQNRLLVRAVEIHTDSGGHAMALRSWESLASRVSIQDVANAKGELEAAADGIGASRSSLPWHRGK